MVLKQVNVQALLGNSDALRTLLWIRENRKHYNGDRRLTAANVCQALPEIVCDIDKGGTLDFLYENGVITVVSSPGCLNHHRKGTVERRRCYEIGFQLHTIPTEIIQKLDELATDQEEGK